ncbi:hypothetical protein [Streptacidiphilus jiangxiensis]|uniref:Uncharacterized protein n=1 Tax=Streptacidiphilus jiangxiensis TaxID=235985 RepID=A0A1H7R1E8_STRJI|nr:hypothetical protein [Streptacidiphilus jiangxiensis]SEL53734.1 hypothetical protein SAMN05414137_109313 [Streptacidiphilus jiangxiensis]
MRPHQAAQIDTIPPHLRALLDADERHELARRHVVVGVAVLLVLLSTIISLAALQAVAP